MKPCRILTIVLFAVLLVGCGGGEFAKEKTLLTTMTKAFETLTAAVNKADAPPAVASALNAFSDKIEKIVPEMKKLSDEHPEWETEPPEELEDVMNKFETASSGFGEAMFKVNQMASQHADNEQLQDAVKKFQSVLGGL